MRAFFRVRDNKENFNIFDAAFFVLVCCITTWLFMTSNYKFGIAGDTGDASYALFSGTARTLQQGELPLWYPYLWGGFSGVGHTLTQSFYPITLFLCKILFQSNTGTLSYSIIMWNEIIHAIILCISSYTLFRILKFRQITGATIAIACTFCFAALGVVEWISFFNAMSWLPLLIAFSILFMRNTTMRSWGYCAFAGLTLGIAGLANQAQSLLINIMIFSFLYFFYMFEYRKNKKQIFRITKQCILTGLIGIGICGVSLFPAIQFTLHASRFIPDVESVQGMRKMPLASFIENGVANKDINGIFMGAGTQGWFSVGVFFAFFLIVSFFIKNKEEKAVYHFAQFSFIFTLLYSISVIFPYVLYYIPFYSAIREPFLYAPYVCIMASILAGYGLDSILSFVKEKVSLKKLNVLFYNIPCFIVVLIIFTVLLLLPAFISSIRVCIILCWALFWSLLIWHLSSKGKNQRFIASIMGLLLIVGVVFDFYSYMQLFGSRTYNAMQATKKVVQTHESVKKILEKSSPKETNPYRISSWGDTAYPSNEAAVLGFYDFLGYVNPMYSKTFYIHSNLDLKKRSQLENIKYFLYTDKADTKFVDWFSETYGFQQVYTVDGVYRTYDDQEPSKVVMCATGLDQGPAWLVYNAVEYNSTESSENLIQALNSPNIDLTKTALVNIDTLGKQKLNLQGIADNSSITMTSYKVNSMRINVNSDKPAILVTAESDYPGWNAYVDGKKVPVIEVNYAFKGVLLEAGTHIVELKYMPTSFIIGICSLIIAVGIFVFLAIKFLKPYNKQSDTPRNKILSRELSKKISGI